MTVYLDIAVAIVLVFFTLSLVVTALNEAVAVLLNLRGRMLLKTLRALVEDEALLDRMLDAAPLRSVLRARSGRGSVSARRFPDWLPPLAVADALLAATAPPASPRTPAAADASLGARLADAARDATDEARTAVAASYEAAMDQLSARYKRRQQLWSVIFGVALAAAFNVNVIALAERLQTDDAARAAIVAHASRALTDGPDGPPAEPSGPLADLGAMTAIAVVIDEVEDADALAEIAGFGWDVTLPERDGEGLRSWARWLGAVLNLLAVPFVAWIVAGVASILGAPFWFDLLGRAMGARRAAAPRSA